MIDAGNVSARQHLRSGVAIPAHPLALTPSRTLDERRQRALSRYYFDAGAGGIAVGVHTTQFAIRESNHGLYRPVLELAARAFQEERQRAPRPFVMVAGVCGPTSQAVAEAEIARTYGYDAGLLSLGALGGATPGQLIAHCRAVADVIPVFGFYLQPAVGGRVLDYAFWREFAEIENVCAIKIAPFDRYKTIDVVRAVAAAGRNDIALYTGNDDSIVVDLVTPFPVRADGVSRVRFIDGGLLGQWAVWTSRAVDLLRRAQAAREGGIVDAQLLSEAAALTDANSAIFDAAHGFAGCIAGIHEVLRRQGLLLGTWCLDPRESLSPGQAEEIERVCRAYPFLADDEFVAAGLDRWLA
ncbi:MAG TPA: dihydrodipicolinate synthase family protein [Gemmatimonadaceae bacterium]|nr:dihydrodipicolinate synthase family protein [Gemmatimonadaceae bacterium]